MIRFRHKGDFRKVTKYFKEVKKASAAEDILTRYARLGVRTLSAATPVETGTTAASWHYEIEREPGRTRLSFYNSNVNDGVQIAIILQYGHGTGIGGWVEGRDYINPAIQPVFDKIAADAWKEVIRL